MPAKANNSHQLTDLQIKFCHEYAKCLNATMAYQRAGYKVTSQNSAAVSASKLLRNVKIRDYLGDILNLSEASVISEVASIAFAEITDVVEYLNGTLKIKDTSKWDDRTRASVKSITYTEVEFGATVKRNLTVTMHDKLSALEKLMKKLQLYPKDISTIGAVQHLLSQGLLTEQQAKVILDGVSRLEEELRTLATGEQANGKQL